jgi:hypothetical protein
MSFGTIVMYGMSPALLVVIVCAPQINGIRNIESVYFSRDGWRCLSAFEETLQQPVHDLVIGLVLDIIDSLSAFQEGRGKINAVGSPNSFFLDYSSS